MYLIAWIVRVCRYFKFQKVSAKCQGTVYFLISLYIFGAFANNCVKTVCTEGISRM